MNTLQTFFAEATTKAAADLETALLRLPEEKRNWSAGGTARSALDMVAEVAILNGVTADTITTHTFPTGFDYEAFTRQKTELSEDWPALKSLLDENTAKIVATIRAVPDTDWGVEVEMPWGAMTLTQIAAYPGWNMRYHEGQINFIASMLGCLE